MVGRVSPSDLGHCTRDGVPSTILDFLGQVSTATWRPQRLFLRSYGQGQSNFPEWLFSSFDCSKILLQLYVFTIGPRSLIGLFGIFQISFYPAGFVVTRDSPLGSFPMLLVLSHWWAYHPKIFFVRDAVTSMLRRCP